MPKFRELDQQQAPALGLVPPKELPQHLWQWWWSLRNEIPAWFAIAHKAVLHQPSLAAVDRFFAQIKGATQKTQSAERDNTIETWAMCIYNREK